MKYFEEEAAACWNTVGKVIHLDTGKYNQETKRGIWKEELYGLSVLWQKGPCVGATHIWEGGDEMIRETLTSLPKNESISDTSFFSINIIFL